MSFQDYKRWFVVISGLALVVLLAFYRMKYFPMTQLCAGVMTSVAVIYNIENQKSDAWVFGRDDINLQAIEPPFNHKQALGKDTKPQSSHEQEMGTTDSTTVEYLEKDDDKTSKEKLEKLPESGLNYTNVEERFVARRERYDTLCSQKKFQETKRTKYVTSIRSQFANSRLTWCHIPKVATTFLKYVRSTHSQTLKQQGVTKYRLSQRKKFFLVREPYSRLVSGYICKIVTTPSFWRRYGKSIISKYRPEHSIASQTCGHDVTFPEFIRYFINSQETGRSKNQHFMPIQELCSICRERYDYIVHLETLKPDMTFIFRSVNVSINIDIRKTEKEIRNKAVKMMKAVGILKNCDFHCFYLRTLWWSFQARGFVSTERDFPINDEDCASFPVDKFEQLAVDAYKEFTDREKRSVQKRTIMVDLYSQVSLEDRLKLKDIFMKDFELFEYEATPKDVFPELAN